MTANMRVLDLFSGIGGFSLGLERTGGFKTIAFCEPEEFCRRVLAKHWPDVPCFPDVRTLKGSDIDGPVDLICGGYPCQPFSSAGKRQGEKDDRHLWPEFARLVVELRPAWVIGENVAGHISMGLDDVLADLEAKGYACRSFVIPACAVGASHRRDRVWTIAHAEGAGNQKQRCTLGGKNSAASLRAWRADKFCNVGGAGKASNVANAISNDAQGQQPRRVDQEERQGPQQRPAGPCGNGDGWRGAQSRMGRVADGFSYQLDEPRERVKADVKDRAARLKALGNAVHPDIPMMIGAAILEAKSKSYE